ncbi:hypothetical protein [Mesorhizobium sp. M0408]|uniref:hypothetical protein n=1 Tax=Mesorhizobium sp. M0408 TaxID=2956942 RepID=UPI00333B34A1
MAKFPRFPSDFPDFGLTPEERRFAERGTFYECAGMDGALGEIWCYSDRFPIAQANGSVAGELVCAALHH